MEYFVNTSESWSRSHSVGFDLSAVGSLGMSSLPSFRTPFGADNLCQLGATLSTPPTVRTECIESIHQTYSDAGIKTSKGFNVSGRTTELKPDLKNEDKIKVFDSSIINTVGENLTAVADLKQLYDSIKTRTIEAHKSEKEAELEAKEVVEEFKNIQAEVEQELAAEEKSEPIEAEQALKSEQKIEADLNEVEKLGVEQVLKKLGDPLKKSAEIAAYEEYIKYSLVEIGKDPHNDTLLRKTRIAIDRYFAKHPEQARAFSIGLQAFAVGGAAIVSAPLIPAGASATAAMAVFAATYYMLDKAGELCSIGIEKAAEKIAEWQTKEPAERANLTADYNLLGTIMLFGFTKKRVGKSTFAGEFKVVREIPKSGPLSEFTSEIFVREVEWTAPNGTGQTYRVIQRGDIDWYKIRTNPKSKFVGKTNLEAALNGKAPELADGEIVQLHHIRQQGKGPILEIQSSTHMHYKHAEFGGQKQNPLDPVNRKAFEAERPNYWKARAMEVLNEKK